MKQQKISYGKAKKKPDMDKRLLMIPPVNLDVLLNTYTYFLTQGGNNVLANPYFLNMPMITKIVTPTAREESINK